MPLFEFRCEECGKTLELLLNDASRGPKMCGFRCALPPESLDEARGTGRLALQHSTFAPVRSVDLKQTITPEQAAKAGMTVYANEGGGRLRKISGRQGPETIDMGEG